MPKTLLCGLYACITSYVLHAVLPLFSVCNASALKKRASRLAVKQQPAVQSRQALHIAVMSCEASVLKCVYKE